MNSMNSNENEGYRHDVRGDARGEVPPKSISINTINTIVTVDTQGRLVKSNASNDMPLEFDTDGFVLISMTQESPTRGISMKSTAKEFARTHKTSLDPVLCGYVIIKTRFPRDSMLLVGLG